MNATDPVDPSVRATLERVLLPGVPLTRIAEIYGAAPGNEIATGKFSNPDSSAALVANAFGIFVDDPGALPPLPALEALDWPAGYVRPETIMRLPWSGGKHPCLDVLIRTPRALIGVESKRYEPYRAKDAADVSDAYDRDVRGDRMAGYLRVRDAARRDGFPFRRLDAVQLMKHALGLMTQSSRQADAGRAPILYYLYAEPTHWGDGRPVDANAIADHRVEVASFSEWVANDAVRFQAATYRELLTIWVASGRRHLVEHAAALARWARL